MTLTRRSFLVGSTAVLGVAGTGSAASERWRRRDPFTLGVASGDPEPDSVVLWTRLAPTPLAEDGHGGVPPVSVPVEWEVAVDPRFHRIVRRGVTPARPEWAHSVHVEVGGLTPDRTYWYRFRTGHHISPAGQTRTAPPRRSLAPLNLAVVSCANWEDGYFTAYRRLVADGAQLVAHVGDYLYERSTGTVPVRRDSRIPTEMFTLRDYRLRHAQYKTDPDLQFAHAALPWAVTWDDHEVANNYADLAANEYGGPPMPVPQFRARRAAAYRAYYEHMPLRRSALPHGPDLPLHRSLTWGSLADLHILDTRQHRDNQVAPDWSVDGPETRRRYDPSRSILGAAQESWLATEIGHRRARWDVLVQQVFFMSNVGSYDYGVGRYYDGWDGYVASRQRVVGGWRRAGVRSPVVLTGDFHENWAGNVTADFDAADSPTVGAEFLVGSVSSEGDGHDGRPEHDPSTARSLRDNPHVAFINKQRGYLLCQIDPDEWRTTYRVLDRVSRPGGVATTRAVFAVSPHRPGLRPAG